MTLMPHHCREMLCELFDLQLGLEVINPFATAFRAKAWAKPERAADAVHIRPDGAAVDKAVPGRGGQDAWGGWGVPKQPPRRRISSFHNCNLFEDWYRRRKQMKHMRSWADAEIMGQD